MRIVFIFLCFSLISLDSFGQCERERDSIALIDLYESLNGEDWMVAWDFAESMDKWFGVILDTNGCVACLDLDGNPNCINDFSNSDGINLSGTLSTEIGNLTQLVFLSLYNNNITGQIPHEIGNLENLERLYLNNNSFTGTIPNSIGNLTNLIHLYLSINSLDGSIPTEIKNLIELTQIGLSNNDLSGIIPDSLENLTKLKFLDFSLNNLSGNIPQGIGLTSLTILRLGNNNLEGEIPESIDDLILDELILSNNNLSGCFSDFACSTVNINLLGNPFLPWQGEVSNYCTGAEQSGAECDDGKIYTLNDIIQDNCFCSGVSVCDEPIHPDYDALMALYSSTNGDNWIEKDGWMEGVDGISCDPCNWNGGAWYGLECLNGRVSTLILGDNNLNGELPKEIGDLDSIIILGLSRNSISGHIPLKLDSLNKLERIEFSNNVISGSIPNFSALPNLKVLSIWNNQLTDTIPNFIGTPNLEGLILRGNQLVGSIPDFSSIPNLINLELWVNQLSGELPNFTNLPNLTTLLVRTNNLSGQFPNFDNLSNLSFVECWANRFDGPIPDMQNCPLLEVFAANNNEFSGEIPTSFKDHPSLRILGLENNSLSGCYFEFLCSLEDINTQGNPLLPWEGEIINYCNGEEQFGVPCNDQDLNTEFDKIDEFCNCTGMACNIQSDSMSLVSLYKSTKGDAWTNPWILEENISTWEGVLLHPSGCVKSIILNDRNLDGILPDSLFELTLIDSLVISNNPQLSGAIPPNVRQIQNCKELDLSGNALTSIIPPDIDDLCDLIVLDLSDNDLLGLLPPSLSNLNNLEVLNLSGNPQLEGMYPIEYQVFCDDLVDFTTTGLGTFEAFCMNGENADQCQNEVGDIFCTEIILAQLEDLPPSSTNDQGGNLTFENVSIGTIEIGPLQYRYLNYQYLDTVENQIVERYSIYGCNDFNFESCTLVGDSIIDCAHDLIQMSDIINNTNELWVYSEDEFIDCISSLDDIKVNANFQIYPNPSFQKINIETEGLNFAEVEIYGIAGGPILSLQFNPGSKSIVDVSSLRDGLYYLIIKLESGEYLSKPLLKY